MPEPFLQGYCKLKNIGYHETTGDPQTFQFILLTNTGPFHSLMLVFFHYCLAILFYSELG